ncbi:proline-rich membrane anchor 1 isoform X2 [Brienomyrus brachyistius]|uniref:proline-rich membrane anchor 1 isoform X2 n=1 Tax=Brienomyrus brachyistius TaxID=42636 RepID=UPI0020B195E9|nr:proline-rich membrane anchor 1 isoform X2 [Brienomyrus brachyistius]
MWDACRLRCCTQGDLQRSCSQTVTAKVSDTCQLACHCRPYPPLPPPPPPPPPPRLLVSTVAESIVPQMKPWWKEIAVLGSLGCASGVFLLLTAIICYKAIKRKPQRKEENGASRGRSSLIGDVGEILEANGPNLRQDEKGGEPQTGPNTHACIPRPLLQRDGKPGSAEPP